MAGPQTARMDAHLPRVAENLYSSCAAPEILTIQVERSQDMDERVTARCSWRRRAALASTMRLARWAHPLPLLELPHPQTAGTGRAPARKWPAAAAHWPQQHLARERARLRPSVLAAALRPWVARLRCRVRSATQGLVALAAGSRGRTKVSFWAAVIASVTCL